MQSNILYFWQTNWWKEIRSQGKRHSNGSLESSFRSVKILNNSLSYWVGWIIYCGFVGDHNCKNKPSPQSRSPKLEGRFESPLLNT
jgi:hypothetical protein